MLIYLETILNHTKIIVYSDDTKELSRFEWQSDRNQTDELLAKINDLIHDQKTKINGIFVNTDAGSYTSARVGLTIANFLGFGLDIQPVKVDAPSEIILSSRSKFIKAIEPVYQSGPFITKQKSGL